MFGFFFFFLGPSDQKSSDYGQGTAYFGNFFLCSHSAKPPNFGGFNRSLCVLSQRETEICFTEQLMGEECRKQLQVSL